MSTGFAVDASTGRSAASVEPRLLGEDRQLEACRLAGIGAENPQPARIGQYGDSPAPRGRLAREQGGDVEELDQGVGAKHARLAEDGVDGGVGSGEGCRM